MVNQRQALHCIAMVTIMLLAVQIPLLDEQTQINVESRSFTAANCQTTERPNGTPIYVCLLYTSDAADE